MSSRVRIPRPRAIVNAEALGPVTRKVPDPAAPPSAPHMGVLDFRKLTPDAPRVVDGQTYYSLLTQLSRLHAEAVAVRFVDAAGRNCAAVLEPVGAHHRPVGYDAIVWIDDGTYCTNVYVGRLIQVDAADVLICKSKDMADMLTLPRPAPSFGDWNGRA